MYGYIYKITCTEGTLAGCFYIGQRKWNRDISKDSYKGSGKIIKDYYKKYPKGYTKEILAIAESRKELDSLEKYYVGQYLHTPKCLNVNEGGNHCHDYKASEETRKKLSAALKGRAVWNKGLKLPPSQMKGKHHTEETKAKISKAKKGMVSNFKGKHFSLEARRKLSESHKGKPSWNKGIPLSDKTKKLLSIIRTKHAVVQMDRNTFVVIAKFGSVREASEMTGVSVDTIYRNCTGKTKRWNKYMWKYIDKQIAHDYEYKNCK